MDNLWYIHTMEILLSNKMEQTTEHVVTWMGHKIIFMQNNSDLKQIN